MKSVPCFLLVDRGTERGDLDNLIQLEIGDANHLRSGHCGVPQT